ncbi:DUF6907 domain-containing protein [Kocuria turfanensis]|uniref:DUF6907 domain-containing protein n=1 Tax=Kocuria turfanensis TaxID=388357 RepID=UPI000787E5CE|nr:hypothetical protein [Kocuria turfanensis]
MHQGVEMERTDDDRRSPGRLCPGWCVARHGEQLGEEDWVHVGEPLTVAEGVTAQLCLSVDPDSGAEDGPYVLIGSSEYTPAATVALGRSLIALAIRAGSRPPR